MNAMTCISFWTTFGGGYIPAPFSADQFGEWIMGCDSCQDACPYNMRHNWDDGEEFPGLADVEELLQPENIIAATEQELLVKVIPRSDHHLNETQADTLRICAKRVLDQTSRGGIAQ